MIFILISQRYFQKFNYPEVKEKYCLHTLLHHANTKKSSEKLESSYLKDKNNL